MDSRALAQVQRLKALGTRVSSNFCFIQVIAAVVTHNLNLMCGLYLTIYLGSLHELFHDLPLSKHG
jgi:hypothetical protein